MLDESLPTNARVAPLSFERLYDLIEWCRPWVSFCLAPSLSPPLYFTCCFR